MKDRDRITVGLLSHYFKDPNLGCVALSICNVLLIDKAMAELGYSVKYIIMVNEKQPHVELTFTESEYEYRVYSSTKQSIKHPVALMKTRVFDDCDLVFNICAGDGFTDIYGRWRTVSESYMTILGALKGKEMILAPQTIGPFNDPVCRRIARYTLNRCRHIFARDHLSYELCRQLGQEGKTTEVVDVALALPFERTEHPGAFNFGINVSGLLYDIGSNRFGLSIDYTEFINKIVGRALGLGWNVHLIAHVNIENETGEDDFRACKAVHALYPDTILAPRFDSPITAKSYIAGLDLFTGARMHATVAAISSGVPVIPIAYSRKVNGLYGNLEYPFYLDAKAERPDTDSAVEEFFEKAGQIDGMKEALPNSKRIYERELRKYIDTIKTIAGSL